MQKIEQTIGLKAGHKNMEYDLDFCGCLGCCDFGPNLLVNNNLILGAEKNNVMEKLPRQQERQLQLWKKKKQI